MNKPKRMAQRPSLFFPRTPSPPLTEAVFVALLALGCAGLASSTQRRLAVCALGLVGWGVLLLAYSFARGAAAERAWRTLAASYDLSALGFLPSTPPARLSGHPDYAALESLSARLPELNRSGGLVGAVDALRCLPEAAIVRLGEPGNAPELRRAYVLLAQLVHSYAHAGKVEHWAPPTATRAKGTGGGGTAGDAGSIDDGNADDSDAASAPPSPGASEAVSEEAVVIPGQLAVPFHFCCAALGLPPVLTAAATDLWNWKLIDDIDGDNDDALGATSDGYAIGGAPSGGDGGGGGGGLCSGDFTLRRLSVLSSCTGSATEANFHAVPTAMHAAAGPLLRQLLAVPALLSVGDDAALSEVMEAAAAWLGTCKELIAQVRGAQRGAQRGTRRDAVGV